MSSRRQSFRKSISNIFKGAEDTHNWGPLLIAIGPNCCGKSTFVKNLGEDVTEFSTESVPDLHVKVPVEICAKVWQDKISGDVVQTLRGQTVYNIPMLERLKKMRGLELTYVALLFSKLMPLQDFEAKMDFLLQESDYGDIFLSAVRELYQTKGVVVKTKTLDIFIGEAVDEATAQTAADLKAAIKTNEGVICWGNTNLNPDFYKDALKIADKYQRVVRFVRWGRELPVLPLRELFKRNILKFLETGRYVSSTKLDKFRKHAEFFISKAGANTHVDYAGLAEYDMDEIGCVSHKVTPITKKPSGRTVTNRYVVWTNTGLVYNITQGPPISPSALADVSRSFSRSTSNNNGGGASHNSSDNEIEPRATSPRAASGKKTPSVAGSNASSTGISFSAAANKSMIKIPSDPNMLPLSADSLQAVSAAAAAAEKAKEDLTEPEPRTSDMGSLQAEEGIAFNSSKLASVDAGSVDVAHSSPAASSTPEVHLQPSSGASKHTPVKLAVDASATPHKPPTAPPTPSRGGGGPVRQSSNGASSENTDTATTASPAPVSRGFSLMGMLGFKDNKSSRESPTISNDSSHAAKFIIDDSAPTTAPHPHTADHSVMLQDSVKLTHIHQREHSLHLVKEKSQGHAADFRKSHSQGAGATAAALEPEVTFAVASSTKTDETEGTPVDSALSPAQFVVDADSPVRPGALTHQPSAHHEVHLQDSVKLAHIHVEEKHLHPHPDEGPIGHPKDHEKHPIFIEPKTQLNENGEEEIGFTSTTATFVLDDHSPRLTHVKTEDGDVLLQDSVKLGHIHEEEKHLHPHPDEGPVGHPKDHEKHPIFIEPKTQLNEEREEEEIGFTSTKSATFVLDDHSPRLTHEKTEDGEVLLQDSVKLKHIHLTAVHDKPLFNPVIVRNDSFDLSESKSAEKKINRTRSSSPPTRKLSFRASLVEEIPVNDDSEANSPAPAAAAAASTDASATKLTPRSAAAALFANVETSAPPAPASFVLDDEPPSQHHHHKTTGDHKVHLQDSVKLAHIHEKVHHDEHHHAPVHVVKIELTPDQNAHQAEKHVTIDQHSPAVVLRSAETSQANSPMAPSSGKLVAENSEDEDEEEEASTSVATTPKKEADANAFACVFPNLFCL